MTAPLRAAQSCACAGTVTIRSRALTAIGVRVVSPQDAGQVHRPNESRLSGGQTRPPGAELLPYLILDCPALQLRFARRCRR